MKRLRAVALTLIAVAACLCSAAPGVRADQPAPPVDAQIAMTRVNQYRAMAGLAPVTYDLVLGQAAAAHSHYLRLHGFDWKHWEDPKDRGFTGKDPTERGRHFGVKDAEVLEVAHVSGSPITAVDGWMEMLYHRLPLISPSTRLVGYGAEGGAVLDMIADRPPNQTIAWPLPDAIDVPTVFGGGEWPDPHRLHPEAPKAPWGYTISLSFPGGARETTLTTAELTDEAGRSLSVMRFDTTIDNFLGNAVAMIPYQPLQPHTRYTVHMQGTADLGQGLTGFDRTWSFRTGAGPATTANISVEPLQGDAGVYHTRVIGATPGLRVFADGFPVADLHQDGENVTFRLPPHLSNTYDMLQFVRTDGATDRVWGWRSAPMQDPGFVNRTLTFRREGTVHQLSGLVYGGDTIWIPESDVLALGVSAGFQVNPNGILQQWIAGTRQAEWFPNDMTLLVNGFPLVLPVPVLEWEGDVYLPQALVEALLGTRMAAGDLPPPLLTDLAGNPAEQAATQLAQAFPGLADWDGTFRPDQPLTRAELVRMLTAVLQIPPVPGGPTQLTDIADHWVQREGYLGAAIAARVVRPADYPGGRFTPDAVTTSAEVIQQAARALGVSDAELSGTGLTGERITRGQFAIWLVDRLQQAHRLP